MGELVKLINTFEQLFLVCIIDILDVKFKESSSASKPRSDVKYFASVSIVGGKLKKRNKE